MNRFEYSSAATLAEAVAQLGEPGVVVKAGGVDLLDRMKEGLIAPTRLVSLRTIPGLDGVRDQPADGLRIGPMVTLAQLAAHPGVRARYAALAQAAEHAATPQIRSMATLGGNLVQRPRCWYFRSVDYHCRKKGGELCFAHDGENQFHAIVGNQRCAIVHPSTPATALVAFGAQVRLTGLDERELLLEDFFVGPDKDPTRENVLGDRELVTQIHVPAPAIGTRSAYTKQGEKESFDWPIADVAVVLELAGGSCRRASIVLGAIAPVPLRARASEAILAGHVVDERSAEAAANAAVEGATPLGKNGYKVPIFRAIVKRTILAAAAGGGAP